MGGYVEYIYVTCCVYVIYIYLCEAGIVAGEEAHLCHQLDVLLHLNKEINAEIYIVHFDHSPLPSLFRLFFPPANRFAAGIIHIKMNLSSRISRLIFVLDQ